MFDYQCELCTGTVRPRTVKREAFKHKNGFVILEKIMIGVCDVCGNRYYDAGTLRTVHEIATGKKQPLRNEMIPVASAPVV